MDFLILPVSQSITVKTSAVSAGLLHFKKENLQMRMIAPSLKRRSKSNMIYFQRKAQSIIENLVSYIILYHISKKLNQFFKDEILADFY